MAMYRDVVTIIEERPGYPDHVVQAELVVLVGCARVANQRRPHLVRVLKDLILVNAPHDCADVRELLAERRIHYLPPIHQDEPSPKFWLARLAKRVQRHDGGELKGSHGGHVARRGHGCGWLNAATGRKGGAARAKRRKPGTTVAKDSIV